MAVKKKAKSKSKVGGKKSVWKPRAKSRARAMKARVVRNRKPKPSILAPAPAPIDTAAAPLDTSNLPTESSPVTGNALEPDESDPQGDYGIEDEEEEEEDFDNVY